jgi:hypothetical protein
MDKVDKINETANERALQLLKKKDCEWTSAHEAILSEWADKANCYKWLHMKSAAKYKYLHNLYTIPVIIMSTLTGTANFAQEKLPEKYIFYAPIIIGCINIMAGIITTIQQFLHINELNEGHRVATISWDKFYRRIKIELSKNPIERQPIREFFITTSEEYDRLMESSPTIDRGILELFKSTFDGTFTKGEIKSKFQEIIKPEICDSLISVKDSIYKVPEEVKNYKKVKQITNDIIAGVNNIEKTKYIVIQKFWDNFKETLMRDPTRDELIDNLINDEDIRGSIEITEFMIDEYLKEYANNNPEDTV